MPVDLIHEKEFASRLIRPDTWIITGHPVSAVTYLLIGGHTALVIDPGEHVRNLRDYVRTITDLPADCGEHPRPRGPHRLQRAV